MFAAKNMTLASGSVYDADAQSWISAVETADAQALEPGVKTAMNQLVLNLKASGLWTPIKTLTIQMAARTLAGALIDVKTPGSSWTNNNFVSGDYNRTTGLAGNGSTKYLDTGRNNNTDPQNNFSLFAYVTTISTSPTNRYMGAGGTTDAGASALRVASATEIDFFNRHETGAADPNANAVGLIGCSRSAAGTYTSRGGQAEATNSVTSQTPYNGNIYCHASNEGGPNRYTTARICAAGIGEAITLSTLETHLATFIASITALSL